ncbi:MAG: hypothetical protein HDR92_08745 [Bacteroides sp.]|nr:hypothetical protein [Bacteroides sp.]
MASLLTDFLEALDVPHTREYSDTAFAKMPFKSLFGFARQLKAYGVDTVAARWSDKSVFPSIPTPFLAETGGSFVIVEAIEGNTVEFRCPHKGHGSMNIAEFEQKWSGLALLAYPDQSSREPDLGLHRFQNFTTGAKKWILIACAAILLAAGIIRSGIFDKAATLALLAVDFAGIGVTWLLILKTLKVSSKSADRICGILQDHGCDTVLEQKASSFFGIFSWSEVGLSYFAVSTITLLLFPAAIGWLALINLCCLPFTFWSIWYQKFRLHTWCTLCVTTQALLWLQAGSYLWSGAWNEAFPLNYGIIVLVAAYATGLLGLNRVVTFIKRRSGVEQY